MSHAQTPENLRLRRLLSKHHTSLTGVICGYIRDFKAAHAQMTANRKKKVDWLPASRGPESSACAKIPDQ